MSQTGWFGKNPKKTLALAIPLIIIIFLLFLEIALRFYLDYNPGYYMYESEASGKLQKYPYGEIPINSEGFPDDEFATEKTKPRVGYLGDSIAYGLGAGYPYRISDLLKRQFPEYEHMNFSYVGYPGVTESNIRPILLMLEKHNLDKVIYILCLNDILPSRTGPAPKKGAYMKFPLRTATTENIDSIRRYDHYLNFLRGRSYLYTHIRYALKNYYFRKGFNENGFTAYEFYPEKNSIIFAQTADRIAKMNEKLRELNISFMVVIVPYEMQISSEAERKYAELGIKWEDGFIERGPQKALIASFDRDGIKYSDAYYAFMSAETVEESRTSNALGEYFVYNKGDRLDWTHPNREGHRKIAEFLIEHSNFFSQ